LCASEIDVPGSMRRCVRVLMHISTSLGREEIRHVYLRDAASLRDDLPG
jgi:chorismate mutase